MHFLGNIKISDKFTFMQHNASVDLRIKHSKKSPDLDQIAQLILSHPSGSRTWDVTRDLHFLHGLDVATEVGACGGLGWTDVYYHQPLH